MERFVLVAELKQMLAEGKTLVIKYDDKTDFEECGKTVSIITSNDEHFSGTIEVAVFEKDCDIETIVEDYVNNRSALFCNEPDYSNMLNIWVERELPKGHTLH